MTRPARRQAAEQLVGRLLDLGLRGDGRLLQGSHAFAERYVADPKFADHDARVRALIRVHTTMSAASGFLTSVGGLITLPVAIPASLTASWLINTQLAGAIASLHGHDLNDARVRLFVLLTLLGDSGKTALRNAGVQVANRVALRGVEAIPGRVVFEINKRVGMRLITKAGERGVVNLAKVVPLAGGVVGGTVDGLYCHAVGRRAHAVFRPSDTASE